ncbi:hypothetical protein DPMN_158601 [Dreissena polymorpha]|uniref:Uncharacterized protein n=1 Tax=Dreissena polymorpha TaxID=45954 RepID=A0A9D4EK39_DREPO|nr:hypothetical protein DPMN_158601 [Dreissena polymorpha]
MYLHPNCLGESDCGWNSCLVSYRNIILARHWTCPNLPPVEVKVVVDETVGLKPNTNPVLTNLLFRWK